jgi:hypothetical protein
MRMKGTVLKHPDVTDYRAGPSRSRVFDRFSVVIVGYEHENKAYQTRDCWRKST